MSKKHAKSPCCNSICIKYGHKRLQCKECNKTWRLRKKKRGRKSLRISTQLQETLFKNRSTTIQSARYSRLTIRQYRYRLQRSLEKIKVESLYKLIPSNTKFILLIDGLWVMCGKKRFVVYFSVIRPIHSKIGHLLPPAVLHGTETVKKWEYVISTYPPNIQKRIVSLVCDGLSGMDSRAENRGWVVQRCQFHFLKTMQRFRGLKNQFVKNKELREEIYQTMRLLLQSKNKKKADELKQHLILLSRDSNCPKWINMHCQELLRHIHSFRAYILYFDLHLPTTNNSMESLCGLARNRLSMAKGLRTEASLLRWMKGFVVTQKTIKCNGFYQPNCCD